MTRPRRHIPGQVVMLTRSCVHRRYLLRPDNYINQVLRFEIARAANRHGQTIHACVAMSNHIHLGVTDTTGERSGFMRDAMREVARKRNRDIGWEDSMWEGRPFDGTVILDRDGIERKLLYIWLNPVEAGLVHRAEQWPGLRILPRHWGTTLRIESPGRHYGRTSPEYIEFTPQPPPGYDDMSLEEVKEHFQQLLREAEDEIRERPDRSGVAGSIKVCRQDPFESPDGDAPPVTRGPRYASKDGELQSRAEALHDQFLSRYERRRQRWVKGKTNIQFPAGTVQLRRCAPIKCKPPDDGEPGLFAPPD